MTNSVFREAVLQVYELAARTERLEIIAPLMCVKKMLLCVSVLPEKVFKDFMDQLAAIREKSQQSGWNPELPSLLRRMLFTVCLSDNPMPQAVEPETLRQVCKRKADCLRLMKEYNALMEPMWAHYSTEVRTAEETACNALYATLEEQFSLWLQLFSYTNRGETIHQQETYSEAMETVHTQFIFPREYANLMDEITVKQTLMLEKLKNMISNGQFVNQRVLYIERQREGGYGT